MQKVGIISREQFLRIAEAVLAKFLALPENPKPEKTGGFLAVLNGSDPRWFKMLFVNEIGNCAAERADAYFGFCQEKVWRLARLRSEGHISGWQSRNTKKDQYGGAIATPLDGDGYSDGRDLIVAFSGLPEHGDEALALVLWMIFRWITLGEARQIAEISGNKLFEPLMVACNDLFDGARNVEE
jgi:hypothetical protein